MTRLVGYFGRNCVAFEFSNQCQKHRKQQQIPNMFIGNWQRTGIDHTYHVLHVIFIFADNIRYYDYYYYYYGFIVIHLVRSNPIESCNWLKEDQIAIHLIPIMGI